MTSRINLSKQHLSVLFLALGVILLFCPMYIKLFSYGWKNANYDHGVFIMPISLFLIYQKRAVLQSDLTLKMSGVFGLMASFLIYLYSFYNDFLFLQVISFIGLVSSLAFLNLKSVSFKEIVFPLAYLIFMVPPPRLLIDSLTIPLKEISAYGGYLLLKLFQIPARVEGMILDVAGNQLFITDACSGYRSMVTLLALGAVYAYSQKLETSKKWLIFLMVIPFGIIGNILRIAFTGFISLKFGLKYAEGFFHETSSVVVFAVTVLGLMIFSKLLTKFEAV